MSSRSEALTILVVDDEGPARLRLMELIQQESSTTVVLEAESGMEAIEKLRSTKPDLVFLDVQMPAISGVDVVAQVGAQQMPLTIFVTAFDQHAIAAFESNALDYLLKPYSDERFEAAMARARSRLAEVHMGELGKSMLRAFANTPPRKRYLDRLVVKIDGSSRLVKVSDVESLQGAGNYVTLHVAGKEPLYRSTLNELSAALDPVRFVRVHRSAIVNIDFVRQLEPVSHGEFDLLLKSGRTVRVSRSYRANLEERLDQPL